LIGGTLPLLVNQIGTPYFPKPEAFNGAILFWEITGRAVYDMRRALFQLKYYGVFGRISGMVIGTLTNFKPLGEPEITEPQPKDVIMEVTGNYTFPIMADLDFGHYTVNLPMPIGIRARMDASKLEFALAESAVQ
jgi:muramoyltetrapeptide carboxypeptidase